ncbi:MAG: hypothetical protein L6407_06545 [Candidatus Delongbacteria bacterium]|nr:hypothetical protein [Candidatus Delongbacteria bacterium]
MKKYFGIILILTNFILIAGEFDLFEEKEELNSSVFQDFKFNKFRASYSLYPTEQKKIGLSFSRYFSRKLGFLIEMDQSDSGSDFKEKTEIIFAGTYKFTKRAWTWVFTGDFGLSVNDDVKDYDGVSKGFRANHVYGRFSAEYIFENGLGLDFSMAGRMPIEFDLDEDVSPIHSIGLIYQF